jgi:hypothetical protein
LNRKPEDTSREDIDTGIDWATLDSQVSTAVTEIETALEEALAATRDLNQWVERLHTLSAFMRQVESGLAEVRHRLKEPPQARRPAPAPAVVPEAGTAEAAEAWPPEPDVPEAGEEPLLAPLEAQEAESRAEPSEAAVAEAEEAPVPAEEEPSERAASPTEVGGTIRLLIESSEANIDLMVVERALRETPGVADVDLLDYAGKRARLQVTLSGGERPEEVADPERLAANVQERLGKLTWNGSLSVSTTD